MTYWKVPEIKFSQVMDLEDKYSVYNTGEQKTHSEPLQCVYNATLSDVFS